MGHIDTILCEHVSTRQQHLGTLRPPLHHFIREPDLPYFRRRLRSLCYDETLWKQLFIDTFPQSQEAACDSGNVRRDRWRQRYIEKAMVEYNWATDNFTSTRFYGHRGMQY